MIPGGRVVDFAAKAVLGAIPLALVAGVAIGSGWWIIGLLLAAWPALILVQLWRGK